LLKDCTGDSLCERKFHELMDVVSKVQNTQSVGILQNTQSVGIFQYRIFSR
jgi:hypothetical protein